MISAVKPDGAKNILFKLFIGLSIVLCVFLLSGCSSGQQQEKNNEPNSMSVTLTVDGTLVDPHLYQEETVEIDEGATAIQVLAASGVEFRAENNEAGTYVAMIGGLVQGDGGEESAWVFRVNDEIVRESVGTYILNDGDAMTMYFTDDGAQGVDETETIVEFPVDTEAQVDDAEAE